jgi:hypothetical protein
MNKLEISNYVIVSYNALNKRRLGAHSLMKRLLTYRVSVAVMPSTCIEELLGLNLGRLSWLKLVTISLCLNR